MSELKAMESATAVIEKVYLVYRKSEADAYIAELEENNKMEVGQLLIQNRELASALHKMYSEEEMRHQKYKRCLAMAERWLFAFYVTNKCNDKFYLRSLKYRELANKFKEAK